MKLTDALEVRIDRFVRGPQEATPERFDIRNKKLKELCRRVDALQEQEVIWPLPRYGRAQRQD